MQVTSRVQDAGRHLKRSLHIVLRTVQEEVRPPTETARHTETRERDVGVLQRPVTRLERAGHAPSFDDAQRVQLVGLADIVLPTESRQKDRVGIRQEHLVDDLVPSDSTSLGVRLLHLGYRSAEQHEEAPGLDEVRLKYSDRRLLDEGIERAQSPGHRLKFEQRKSVFDGRRTSQKRPLRRSGSTRRECSDARG